MGADKAQIIRILAEEYGITNERELNEAIRKQGFINVAPFCAPPRESGRKRQHDKEVVTGD